MNEGLELARNEENIEWNIQSVQEEIVLSASTTSINVEQAVKVMQAIIRQEKTYLGDYQRSHYPPSLKYAMPVPLAMFSLVDICLRCFPHAAQNVPAQLMHQLPLLSLYFAIPLDPQCHRMHLPVLDSRSLLPQHHAKQEASAIAR